jgi:cell division protein FtsL
MKTLAQRIRLVIGWVRAGTLDPDNNIHDLHKKISTMRYNIEDYKKEG